jgi:hypothetical protein
MAWPSRPTGRPRQCNSSSRTWGCRSPPEPAGSSADGRPRSRVSVCSGTTWRSAPTPQPRMSREHCPHDPFGNRSPRCLGLAAPLGHRDRRCSGAHSYRLHLTTLACRPSFERIPDKASGSCLDAAGPSQCRREVRRPNANALRRRWIPALPEGALERHRIHRRHESCAPALRAAGLSVSFPRSGCRPER